MARILVIDDSESVRLTLEYFLVGLGHSVTLVSDGPAGIREATVGRFDLLMVDVNMPGMSGLAVCAELRREPGHASLPIVIMTGAMNRLVADWACRAGASVVISKPFDWDSLKAMIDQKVAVRSN